MMRYTAGLMAALFSPPDPEPDPPSSTRPTRGGDAPMPVSVLAATIKAVLADGLPGKVRVVGEVSNLSNRQHWFFSLKDASASIRCVMFASSARRVGFPVKDGMEVVATGRVDFYDAQGSVQLYIDKLEPVGQGARELALQAMVAELRELGYFDLEHKNPLPVLPRKIAVVTSRSAAALQDVINTAGRRWAGCQLLLYDVRVQGEDAAPQVAEALRRLSAKGPALSIDAVILTRGGGSIEDLWAFNERIVADAVFECQLPIVAAIGHETDTTVAELVADVRCATPTQAAMTLIPDHAVLVEQVEQLSRRMTLTLRRRVDRSTHTLESAAGRLAPSLHRRLDAARHRLDAVARHTLFRQPQRLVLEAEHRLDQLVHRLHAAPSRRLADAQRRLDALARTLEAVGPANVLERGYTYTLGPDGKPLRSTDQAKPGTKLTTVLQDGQVHSTVDGGPPTPSPADNPFKPRRLKPYKKRKTDDGPTLFA